MPYTDLNSIDNPTLDEVIEVAWGDQVRTNFQALYAPPTCRAQRATNQSVADETDTGIAADTLYWDSHSMHSVVGGVSRLTVPAGWAGIYQLEMCTNWQSNGDGYRKVFIRKNGQQMAGDLDQMGWGGECEQSLTTKVRGIVGDYFEFFVRQNCGLALNLEPLGVSAQTIAGDWYRALDTVVG